MPSPKPEPLSPPLSIWLVNPFDPIPGEGLPASRPWSLARVLAQRGHDVTWWTATWGHHRRAVRSVPGDVREEEGFAVRLVAVRPYEGDRSLARLASHRDFGRNFERLAHETVASGQLERPDLIVASLPPLEGAEAARRVAERLDAALVVDVQDLWPESFDRLVPGPAFLRRLLAPWLARGVRERRRAVLAAADAVSAASRTHLEGVAADIRPDAPRHVCLPGSYLQEFPEPPRVLEAVPTSGADQPLAEPPPLECVCNVASADDQDLDVATVVSAARHLSTNRVAATIHVVATDAQLPALSRAAAGLQGPCRIEVHGPLTRPQYVALLSRGAVGLVIADPASRGAPRDEACDFAAAGLAIVSTLPGEFTRLLEDHAAGVACAAGDGAALARAIADLAGDRRRLIAVRHAARRLAAAEFDRERIYPLFSDWLETVCAQPRT